MRRQARQAIEEANRQNGFVFWNHPNWPRQRPDGVAKLTDMHRSLIADGLLHGIEVANGDFYSAESLQIALDNDLAILGVSDVHYLIDWDYMPHAGGHRTVTLVFAEERTAESIKEALHANRTVAWLGNWLIGREDALMPLLEASLRLTKVERSPGDELIDIRLSNMSDAAFDLRVTSGHRFNGPPSTMRVEPSHRPGPGDQRRGSHELRDGLRGPERDHGARDPPDPAVGGGGACGEARRVIERARGTGVALTLYLIAAGSPRPAGAQSRAIQFPDVDGYQMLAVDLHTHSVFSDGSVWPVIRVQESERDGVSLFAVTEHLEFQPRAADIPNPDRNRSYAVAAEWAGSTGSDVIVVNGAEISRDMPPGHVNAVFLREANALLMDDAMEVLREANRQGAFVFWNHPNWISQRRDGVARLTDMHKELIANGLLHGIEVANAHTYSAGALQIALDYNLAILGVSDIHGLIDWDYEVHGGGHQTVTLVLAGERTAESIREALDANRTAAWKEGELIAREDILAPCLRRP